MLCRSSKNLSLFSVSFSTSTTKQNMSTNNINNNVNGVIFGDLYNPLTQMANTTTSWKVSTKDDRAACAQAYEIEKAKWQRSPKYNSTIARHFVEDVHSGFRRAFTSVVDRYKSHPQHQVDVASFRRVVQSLTHHHTIEDEMFFPAHAKSCPETKEAYAWLERDHGMLHPLEEKVLKNGDGEALIEFVDFLFDHLNREEMLLVPYMLAGKMPMF